VFGLPLSYIALAFFGSDKSHEKKHIKNIVAFIIVSMLPLSFFFYLNAHMIVKIIFARGAFKARSVALTAEALKGFSPGIWAGIGAFFLQRVLSAYLENVKVLKFFLLFAVVDILLKVFLFPQLQLMGLTLAESVAKMIYFLAILYDLRILGYAIKNLIVAAPGAFLLLLISKLLSGYSGFVLLIAQLVFVVIFVGTMHILGVFSLRTPKV
jgi:putative peptidoglycan lipid II flippase